MKRACPVNHCSNRVAGNGVMCNRCWDALPEQIQYRIVRAYWDWRAAKQGRHGTAESIEIETILHRNHAIAVRGDAISAAGFARRQQRIPAQLYGAHHRPAEIAA